MKTIQFRTKERIHGIEKGVLSRGVLEEGKVLVCQDLNAKNPRFFPFEKIDIITEL